MEAAAKKKEKEAAAKKKEKAGCGRKEGLSLSFLSLSLSLAALSHALISSLDPDLDLLHGESREYHLISFIKVKGRPNHLIHECFRLFLPSG